jgi:hypothetical protein
MNWQNQLRGDTLSWLLEPDNPGVRYLTMRDLLDLPADDRDLIAARELAHTRGPIAVTLDAMHETGYWAEPGPGYYPKYRSTVWSLIMLAQLGASADLDKRIERACQYYLDQGLTDQGQVSASGAPSGTADCMQGNLCAALLDLGVTDARLDLAFEWMARSVTGDGVAPMGEKDAPLRYYAGKCGPLFACGSNNKQPCAWGGVKVMLAFGKLPSERRTPLIERAIQQGAGFFLGVDPATAAYPNGWTDKPSGNWWKFGFPVFYVTDLLQLVEALARLGYGADPRLANAWQVICDKQDKDGRWLLEYDYTGKTWANYGKKKESNKWVTLRALQALKLGHTPSLPS